MKNSDPVRIAFTAVVTIFVCFFIHRRWQCWDGQVGSLAHQASGLGVDVPSAFPPSPEERSHYLPLGAQH